MTPAPAIEPVEGGFYLHADGTTIAVTKILATAVKFVVLGATDDAAKEQKLSLKQFPKEIAGVADVPLPIVGELYRDPDPTTRDEYILDAVRVMAVTGNSVKYVDVEDYGGGDEPSLNDYKQYEKLVAFVTKYTERVYEPKHLPTIVAGGVYRDHDGSLLDVLRVEKSKKGAYGPEDVAIFRVNGDTYEYREVTKFLAHAVSATLDRSALTSNAFAEADYAAQVASALTRFSRAEALVAEATEEAKETDAAVKAAKDEYRNALAGLKQIGNGQAMLPGVHAALVGGTGE